MTEDLMTRLELMSLQDAYVAALDADRLEDWPTFFTDDCLYEIIPAENEEFDLPAPLIQCSNNAMLRDRVISLRHANIYEQPAYRHMVSGMTWSQEGDEMVMTSSYVVVNTSIEGESEIYQAGCYKDRVVRTPEGLRFRQKRCVYDTLRVQTLLAYPI